MNKIVILLILAIFSILITTNVEAVTISSCQNITTSGVYNLSSNLISNNSATCVNIFVNNVNFNCLGFSIIGNKTLLPKNGIFTNGSNVTLTKCTILGFNVGINASNTTNGLFCNNNITTVGNFSYGINLFNDARNNIICNNTIITNGTQAFAIHLDLTNDRYNNITGNNLSTYGATSYAVLLRKSNYNIIKNNKITTSGSSNGAGIYLSASSENNTIELNNITTTGASTGYGLVISLSNSNIVKNNRINTTGTTSRGIYLSSCSYNLFDSNTIITSGSSADGIGLLRVTANVVYNNLTKNNITTNGSMATGILLQGTGFASNTNNNLNNNVIKTSGIDGSGIYLSISDNNNINNNNINTTGSAIGIRVDSSVRNNITSNLINIINQYGIYLSSGNSHNVSQNTINTTGTAGQGIELFDTTNNTISLNNITINGFTYAIDFAYNSIRNSIISNNLNVINSSSTTIRTDTSSGNNTFYYNNFTGNGYWVNNSNSSNNFNISVAGTARGNYYSGINAYNITDSNGDVWADSGSQYPLNSVNVPSRWIGMGADYAPFINKTVFVPLKCFNITSSGTYNLNGSLQINNSNCINIYANNVVLDCKGYNITGNNATGMSAIYTNMSNTTVKNCNIIIFNQGLLYYYSKNSLLQNNTIFPSSYTDFGVIVQYSHNFSASNNIIISNATSNRGIYTYESNASIFNNSITVQVQGSTGILSINGAVSIYNNVFNSYSNYGAMAQSIYIVGNNFSIFNNSINSGIGAIGVALFTCNGSNSVFSNKINSSDIHIRIFESCKNVNLYYNNLTGSGLWVNDSGTNNTFNTSVGGTARGNYYSGINAYNIFDSNGNGWGDSGSQYPLNSVNVPSKWVGPGNDYAPFTTKIVFLSCFNITSSGTYNLTNNLQINNSNCINIYANNVVLDCKGYTITGNDSVSKSGVYANSSNITVKNCNINKFYYGTNYVYSNNSFVQNNTITMSSSGEGIYLYGSNGSVYNNIILINASSANGIVTSVSRVFIFNNSIIVQETYALGIISSDYNTSIYNNFININASNSTGIQVQGNYGIFSVFNNSVNSGIGSWGLKLAICTSSGNVFLNKINSSYIHIKLFSNCSNISLYYNNFTGSGLWINSDIASNSYFNTSVNGTARGNYYSGINAFNITDSNGDGWGDSGSQYPLNSVNVPSKWVGSGVDYAPAIA